MDLRNRWECNLRLRVEHRLRLFELENFLDGLAEISGDADRHCQTGMDFALDQPRDIGTTPAQTMRQFRLFDTSLIKAFGQLICQLATHLSLGLCNH